MAFTDINLKRSSLCGALAFLAGYGVTFAVVGWRFRSFLAGVEVSAFGASSTLLQNFMGEVPAGWTGAGWVFYNAHMVTVNLPTYPGPSGLREMNLLMINGGLDLLLVAVPVVCMTAAGYVAAAPVDSTTGGELWTGAAIAVGYLPLTVAGFVAFSYAYQPSGTGATYITPNPLTALLLMGLALPGLFGALGGALVEHVGADLPLDGADGSALR